MPLRLLCPLVLVFFLLVLLLRKEEKKASLLQSYNLITASGNSIRQKPICFSIALVQWERNYPYPAYCPKPFSSGLGVCRTVSPTGYSELQLPPHFCWQAQLYLPVWRKQHTTCADFWSLFMQNSVLVLYWFSFLLHLLLARNWILQLLQTTL